MEVENVNYKEAGEDDVPLPGFRFHPTDEELVAFYLRRKVEKRPISIELIKQADIYKHDPWDLPREKESYFFCRRGRKYRNSIRPNRVTASGFWKATGIDKPIYSSAGGCDCIGLKKSLVYYRGSAGKGTKTDWMMHEFRLPPGHDKSTKHVGIKSVAQEAEVWTLCRILKRNVSYRKCVPDWRDKRNITIDHATSNSCSMDSTDHNSYISFNAPPITQSEKKTQIITNYNQQFPGNFSSSSAISQAPSSASSFSSSMCADINELLRHADWEDLRSIVDCAAANPFYL